MIVYMPNNSSFEVNDNIAGIPKIGCRLPICYKNRGIFDRKIGCNNCYKCIRLFIAERSEDGAKVWLDEKQG